MSLKINEIIRSFQTGGFFFLSQLNKCANNSFSKIHVMYFFEFELYIYNRYTKFYSSFMIAWRSLDRLPMNSPLFSSVLRCLGRTLSTFRSSFFVDNRKLHSIPMHPKSLSELTSSTYILLYVQ